MADREDTWLEATTRTTRQCVASLFLLRCPSQAIFSSHCDHLSNCSRSVIGSKAHSIGTVFMEGVNRHFAPVATANAPSETTTTTATTTTTTQGIERFGTACSAMAVTHEFVQLQIRRVSALAQARHELPRLSKTPAIRIARTTAKPGSHARNPASQGRMGE